MKRVRAELTGSVVGGGVGTLHTLAVTDFQPDIADFWQACAAVMAGQTTVKVPAQGDVIESTNGLLEGTWFDGTGETYIGGGSGAFAAGVGAALTWRTGVIRGTRRVLGRTFIVPLALNQYDSDGTLTTGAINTLSGAANGLIAAQGGALCVWSRPVTGGDGVAVPVTSVAITDRVAFLRSRRQ